MLESHLRREEGRIAPALDGPPGGAGRLLGVPRAVVLVEGMSDRSALLTVAARLGRDLGDVAVVAMGGITNLGRHLDRLGRRRPDPGAPPAGAGGPAGGGGVVVAGLVDAAEEPVVRRALGEPDGPLERHGFFVCRRDPEDEFLRAVGPGVERVPAENGDLATFRLLQAQPAQRGRPVEAQLRRFLGSTSGRKERYARILAAAAPPERLPAPLVAVLDRVAR